jgi:hypothetical protein
VKPRIGSLDVAVLAWFSLDTDTDVEIAGVRIRNGRTGGLDNVTACPSVPGGGDEFGGGIFAAGALTLTGDVITANGRTSVRIVRPRKRGDDRP